MMFYLHKIAAGLSSPVAVGLAMLLAALLLGLAKRRRSSLLLVFLSILWFWLWSTAFMTKILAGGIIERHPPLRDEDYPNADAIVVLGGGIDCSRQILPYPDFNASADRVWHAARLWKLGKAPVVIASGSNEEHAAKPFLLDQGVPPRAILVEGESRNTRENARCTARLLKGKKRILLVTSAWHMDRSLREFAIAAPWAEIVAVPTDYDIMGVCSELNPFIPLHYSFANNTMLFKERLGYAELAAMQWLGGFRRD